VRALYPVIVAVLDQLGLVSDPKATPLAGFCEPMIENYRGTLTGQVKPELTLTHV